MKKTLIATTLRIIPKTLQNKALCKALNYALAKEDLSALQEQIIKLNVNDLKRSWFVTYDGTFFIPTKKRKTTLELKTKFNTAICS
jgi:predicted lipid carrier protein YhbT